MNSDKSWKLKTLEQLENDIWPASTYTSYLVVRCHELRKIPLEKFTTEDLRIMIGQEIGLEYLVPLALDILKVDLFAESHLFEGDLLKNVLTVNTNFWNLNKLHWEHLNNLIKERKGEIESYKFDLTNFDNSIHNVK